MKALLLIAHGSRSASANAEIRALAAQLQLRGAGGFGSGSGSGSGFERVEHAFLEMAEPTIVQGGAKLVADGAGEIVVLPYFLAAGRHVAEDIPAEVALIEAQHPEVKIIMAAHLGAAAGIQPLIHEHLQKSAETNSP